MIPIFQSTKNYETAILKKKVVLEMKSITVLMLDKLTSQASPGF